MLSEQEEEISVSWLILSLVKVKLVLLTEKNLLMSAIK